MLKVKQLLITTVLEKAVGKSWRGIYATSVALLGELKKGRGLSLPLPPPQGKANKVPNSMLASPRTYNKDHQFKP